MDEFGGILDEAVKETFGTSNKKWALVLVAFVAGAVFAMWLAGRRSTRPELAPAEKSTT